MPRRQRFSDPLLKIAWRLIELLEPGPLYELLREIATVLAIAAGAPRSFADKVNAGVVALRDATDAIGHLPSLRDYRQARLQWPELNLRPTARYAGGSAATGMSACDVRYLTLQTTETSSPARSASVTDTRIVRYSMHCTSARRSFTT
jgi:hypothetical protein